MKDATTHRRRRPAPPAPFLASVGRRLDVLRGLTDPTPAEAAELSRLSAAWAHLQPMPAPRPARRLGTPARLSDD